MPLSPVHVKAALVPRRTETLIISTAMYDEKPSPNPHSKLYFTKYCPFWWLNKANPTRRGGVNKTPFIVFD